jgi:3-hydroxyisobutyrate dehydrogenase
MRIGILGLGQMGRAIAERLTEKGHPLTVWNRSRSKAEGLAETVLAESPYELAKRVDIIFSILRDDKAINDVYFGEQGLCSGQLTDKIIVEMTTTSPKVIEKLASDVESNGGSFLECPVGGTIGPARDGQLLGLAAGEYHVFQNALPVLNELTRRVEYLGKAGNGAAMKLAINLPLMVYWGAVGEALLSATAQGIDPDIAASILVDSSGAIGAAKKRLPPILDMLKSGDPGSVSFSLAGGIKDMNLMTDLGQKHGISTQIIEAALNKANVAADGGWADYDTSLYGIFTSGKD